MILHYAPDNASLCIRLALIHLDVPFDTVLVDRSRHAQRDPSYLALNPNGLIPTLETPQGVMFETGAILLWLDEQHGSLLPATGADRAMALKWLFWLSNTLHPSQRMMFYPDTYSDGDPEDVRAPIRRRIARLLQVLSDAPDAGWLEGPPSAMAWYLAPLLRWCALYGGDTWFTLSDFPRLMEFAKRIEHSDVAMKAALAEGLGPTPFSAPRLPNPPEGTAV